MDAEEGDRASFPLYIYKNAGDQANRFTPGGRTGDRDDIKIDEGCGEDQGPEETCVQVRYNAEKKYGQGWADLYWQSSSCNWGFFRNGLNLSGAGKIYFSARGEKGDEMAEFYMGGTTGKYPDSTMKNSAGIMKLSREWKIYEIDLSGKNLDHVINGFSISFSSTLNPDGCVLYLDNLYYSESPSPVELITLSTTMQKCSNKRTLAISSFENIDLENNIDYYSWIIPNMLDIYFCEQTNLCIINHDLFSSIDNSIPVNRIKRDEYRDRIFSGMFMIDYRIRGTYKMITNNIVQIHIRASECTGTNVILDEVIQGYTLKNILIQLKEFSVRFIARIR
ncbi:MAG: hypothetical protein PHF84_10640 [bacterium]|nr:hypothetical protein [bacterium]